MIRIGLALLLGLSACMSTAHKSGVGADESAEHLGAWIGLDATGEFWWRLQLDRNATGRAGIAVDQRVATYRITHWEADPAGALVIVLRRSEFEATAIDSVPAHLKLTGAGDGTRLRLRHGTQELVFWREDRLIRQRNLLKQRMAAKP